MAEGPSSATANSILDAIGNATNWTAPTAFWVELHTAAPGAAGTTAIAGNATRKQVSFGTAASGAMSNDTAVSWTSGEVDTSEDYTHWSAWTLVSGGDVHHVGDDHRQRRHHRRHVHHPDRRFGFDGRHRLLNTWGRHPTPGPPTTNRTVRRWFPARGTPVRR